MNVTEVGLSKLELILVLTEATVNELDVIKWNNKYYDVLLVEDVYWAVKGTPTLQYKRCTCQELLEFLGA